MASEEKTETATPRRRQEARKKGQVARSQEVGSAAILVAGACMLALYGRYMYGYMKRYMEWSLSPEVFVRLSDLNESNIGFLLSNMVIFSIKIMAPFAAVLVAVALINGFMQVGFHMSLESIKPKFSKLNPINGFKRLFSMRSVTELLKSIFKIAIVGYVGFASIRAAIPKFLLMTDMGIEHAFMLMCVTMLTMALKIGLVLIVLAVLDMIYQKYDFEKSIKMTKQEVKDEYKQREGDPLVRRRIREKQREIAMRRMMAAVPNADVVITNPVELAIALEYAAEEMHAPKVTAKGGGVVAEKIKQVAKENNVPIIEDKPLAQSLFKLTDVGDYVPPQLFKAVAEILAYVYRVSKKKHRFGI
ncbi:MAG TPA: flagellar biosynthesis protein FlhB [bacterium]|mgnify:CR=1 FL=1|nr:flagellar biosynthesis protein FlhB [bacterium]